MSSQNQNEYPATNPEQLQQSTLVEALKVQPGYHLETIQDRYSFVPDQDMTRGTTNENVGVDQDLKAVILAGDDVLGLVKVQGHDPKTHQPSDGYDTFMLTHIKEGSRATILGVVSASKESLAVGRIHQDGLSTTTSRNHFTIKVSQEGVIEIDQTGANGTEIIRPKSDAEIQAPQNHGKLGFLAAKKRAASRGDETYVVNPLNDFNIWSAASKDAKQALDESDPIVKFITRTKSEDTPVGTGDPKAIRGLVEVAGDKVVSLQDLYAEAEGKDMELEVKTGRGVIRLQRKNQAIFSVLESEDPSMRSGQDIKIDGSTIGGSYIVPNALAPQTRLAFIRRMPLQTVRVAQAGEQETDMVWSSEKIALYEDKYKNIIQKVNDSEYAISYFDPSPRMTDYLESAHVTFMDENGVSKRDLF